MMISGITLESAYELLNICSKCSINDISYIKKQFEDNHTNFNRNIDFLEQIGLIKYSAPNISTNIVPPVTKDQIVDALSENIKKFPEIEEFLDNFYKEENSLVFKPTLSEIVKSTEVRQMLMSFGLLEATHDVCKIVNASLLKKIENRPISLEMFKRRLHRQERIGEYAEQYVIKYELEQIKNYPETITDSVVKQISTLNVCAGYDIESFCKKAAAQGTYKKIFIEVKAIMENEIIFFWSNNEILTAQKYGNRYYLYLVNEAIIQSSKLADKQIIIISDPYKNVFCNPKWIQKKENILFRYSGDNNGG